MKKHVHYLMSGDAHAPYLLVSLASLRQHFDGEVTVHAWAESYDVISRIAEDKNLRIRVLGRNPAYRGKNDQFLDKIRLMRSQDPQSANLYLDADTIIANPIDFLFEALSVGGGFVATQFADWTTAGSIIRRRVERLRAFPTIDSWFVQETLNNIWPSVNGGVFASVANSPVLETWEKLTAVVARDVFIADETVLHILQPMFVPNHMIVALGGKFNCSPKHKPSGLPDDAVAIWHGHGDSFLRPEKSQKGFDLWWPKFVQCCDGNTGYVHSWLSAINYKWLNQARSRIQCG